MATIGTLVIALVSDSARFEQGMARARRQTDELEKAIRQLEKGGLDRMAAGMTASAAQTSKVSDWMRKLGDASSQTSTALTKTTTAAASASGGFRKVENAIVDMGLKVVGLDGKMGRMAEGFLELGVGGPVTLAVTGGLLLVGGAVAAVTRQAREAQKAYDDYLASLQQTSALALVGAQVDQMQKKLAAPQFGNTSRVGNWLLGLFGMGSTRTEQIMQLTQAQQIYAQLLEAFDAKRKETDAEFRKRAAREAGSYDFGRVRNPYFEELAHNEGRRRLQEFEERQRQIRAMFSDLGKLSPDAPSEEEIYRSVEQSAARAASRAGESVLKRIEATAIGRQQQMAKFVEAVWVSAAQNIQSATADVFQSIFNGQIKSLGDFARSVVGIVQRAIAEILAAQATAGLAPFLRVAFAGAGSGIPAAPDTSWLGGANGGVPTSFSRAQATVVNVTYAPTVYAIDAQNTQRFLRQNRASLAAEVGRVVGESSMARAALGR